MPCAGAGALRQGHDNSCAQVHGGGSADGRGLPVCPEAPESLRARCRAAGLLLCRSGRPGKRGGSLYFRRELHGRDARGQGCATGRWTAYTGSAIFPTDRIKQARKGRKPPVKSDTRRGGEGEITEILVHANEYIVGELIKQGGRYYVLPDNRASPPGAYSLGQAGGAKPQQKVRCRVTVFLLSGALEGEDKRGAGLSRR